jgi:AAA family ATP:ADP antiporter
MLERLGSGIERLTGAEVRPGERRLVKLFFLNLFLLLTAYYILKVVREPLILLNDGAVSRSYARGLQAFLLMALIPAYSLLANRWEPARLVNWINGFFIVSLGVFVVLGAAGIRIGFAFFVWLGIFSTMAIAQFWSLANDLLTESEGRRLFPLVAAGGTVGGIAGSQIAAQNISEFGIYQLMFVAAGLLLGCALLTRGVRNAALAHRQRTPRDDGPIGRDSRGGFTLVLSDRYLLLIGVSILLLNLINTTGDFVLAEMVNTYSRSIAAGTANPGQAQEEAIGEFYGNFQTAITTLTALIQILLVARIFKSVGVSHSLLFLPMFVVMGYGAAALIPTLALTAIVKITENSADYSLQNTLQQSLFLPTSRDVKYKAKAAIDTFIVRAGDLSSAVLVGAGVYAGLTLSGFLWANVALGFMWLVIAWRIGKHYRRISKFVERPAGGYSPSETRKAG